MVAPLVRRVLLSIVVVLVFVAHCAAAGAGKPVSGPQLPAKLDLRLRIDLAYYSETFSSYAEYQRTLPRSTVILTLPLPQWQRAVDGILREAPGSAAQRAALARTVEATGLASGSQAASLFGAARTRVGIERS